MLELDDCIQRTPSPAHRHALKHQTTAFRELVPLLICTHSNTRRLHSENSFPYLYARTQTPDDCIQRTRPLAHMHALKHQTTVFRELVPLLICTHSNTRRLHSENSFPCSYARTHTPDDCIQRTRSRAHMHALKHQTTTFRELVPLLICTHSNTRRLHSENSFPCSYACTQAPEY